jgi:hypothetical protein
MDTMIYSIAGLLSLLTIGAFAFQFYTRLRALQAPVSGKQSSIASVNVSGRYRPMLRLLAEDDFAFLAGNPKLISTLRAERHKLFRSYLRSLTREYGRLLAGIRMVMVQSKIDRPDLARALAKNRTLFALAICRIEFRLSMHAMGLGTVDISGVVEAFDRLREHAVAMSALPAAA